MSLSWYINRLRTMSAPEMAFRFGQYLQKKREKRTQTHLSADARLQSLPRRVLPFGKPEVSIEKTELSIFGLPLDYSRPIDWHLDLSTGRRFPLEFAKDIDIRTGQYGSAKHVWEVNRLQFLPLIALQYASSGKQEFLQQFREHITSWAEGNPYLMGVNWYSNIEVNIRLIVWFFCWEILDVNVRMEEDAGFREFVEKQWVPLIYLHCKYSHENPSRFSSANNHLVSEYAGLFMAASYWSFEESAEWAAYARAGLEEEIHLQHSPHGVNKEEAAEYIQFITDFFLFPYVLGKHLQQPFSDAYAHKLEQILEYIYQLMDVQGNIPYYGDEDDGKVCVFSDDPHADNFRSLLVSGVILFGKAAWKAKAGPFDTKNYLLFGEKGKEAYEAVQADPSAVQSRFYVEEGHFIMRRQDGRQEMYVHMDAAPLGFLSIAAHGHADALSFVLHIDGQPVITDAGTYTYHTEREWRNYFIGTLSHNTIRVDETDQAKSTGPTMWIDHYQTEVLHHAAGQDKDVVLATHNGYSRLGVTHQREIVLDKQQEKLIITDTVLISPQRMHTLEVPFHLHPAVEVQLLKEGQFLLTAPGARPVLLQTDRALEYTIVKGQQQPLLGWFSSSFQKKEPTQVLYARLQVDHTISFRTEVSIHSDRKQ